MRKHFELTEETRSVEERIVYRIRALVDLPHHNVKAGDLGGFVEGEHNLRDEAWVADNATVCDNAALHRRSRAENHALVMGDASAWGSALIKDHATVYDFALVNQDATVSDHAQALGGPKVYSKGISFVVDEVETALRLGAEVKDEGMVDAIAASFRAKTEEMGEVGWRACIK